MNLTLFFDHRFKKSPEGFVYSEAAYNYEMLANRYLSVFDGLQIVARVEVGTEADRQGRTSEGEGISVVSVGVWRGPADYLRSSARVTRKVQLALESDNALMFIAPGSLGQIAKKKSTALRPYGLEVVGDPFEVFAPGAINHPARGMLRWWSTKQLRQQCQTATTVAYVSESLATRYPAPQARFSTQYSSIELLEEHFAVLADTRAANQLKNPRVLKLVTVASMEVPYKAIDDLLVAFEAVRKQAPEATLTIVGDGQLRSALEQKASDLRILGSVLFTGRLPAGDPIRNVLDGSDIFVLPSRTEGLPRAMIEAMARGLPCVGTRVGGIPELLPKEDLVSANDPAALAAKLLEVAFDPQRMLKMSARNLERAKDYRYDVLQARRVEMYKHLREATREWKQNALR